MEHELTELVSYDLDHYVPKMSVADIIDIFQAYDIRFIRNFGSDLFYVEMVDGEPLVPMHPQSAYPPGIEKLFDFMTRERISMLSHKDEMIMKSYFSVDGDSLDL